ncbi:hypothetical protein FRC12_002484 [Ceratobasidium sp. 428]|nr:hypothetical protein FRC12_002484 [Ceratobasidium sp. 428]
MPEIYDRVDAVVRLATTNPFNTAGRGMSNGEYSYTAEIPEIEAEFRKKAEQQPKQPGVTTLPSFNPHPQDPPQDSGRRQRRAGYGQEDTSQSAQTSRRGREMQESPNPPRRRTRETERLTASSTRQVYREQSPVAQSAYHDAVEDKGGYINEPPHSVGRSFRPGKQIPAERNDLSGRQPHMDSSYQDDSDEGSDPVRGSSQAKNVSGLSQIGSDGRPRRSDVRGASPSSRGQRIQQGAAQAPPLQALSPHEGSLVQGPATLAESTPISAPSVITDAKGRQPANGGNPSLASMNWNGMDNGNQALGPTSGSSLPQQLVPPWYWHQFNPQSLPRNIQTGRDLCPSCVEKSVPKVCGGCQTTYTPNKPEPAQTEISAKPAMDELNVRATVQSELDRVIKEAKLVEGLAGEVINTIRAELSSMVSGFTKELVESAVPAVVQAAVPALTQAVTLSLVQSAMPALVEAAVPALALAAAPVLTQTAVPALVASTTPALVDSATPALVESATPALVKAVAPAFVEAAAPALVEAAIPALVQAATPALVEAATPALIETATPALTEAIAQAKAAVSLPNLFPASASAPALTLDPISTGLSASPFRSATALITPISPVPILQTPTPDQEVPMPVLVAPLSSCEPNVGSTDKYEPALAGEPTPATTAGPSSQHTADQAPAPEPTVAPDLTSVPQTPVSVAELTPVQALAPSVAANTPLDSGHASEPALALEVKAETEEALANEAILNVGKGGEKMMTEICEPVVSVEAAPLAGQREVAATEQATNFSALESMHMEDDIAITKEEVNVSDTILNAPAPKPEEELVNHPGAVSSLCINMGTNLIPTSATSGAATTAVVQPFFEQAPTLTTVPDFTSAPISTFDAAPPSVSTSVLASAPDALESAPIRHRQIPFALPSLIHLYRQHPYRQS